MLNLQSIKLLHTLKFLIKVNKELVMLLINNNNNFKLLEITFIKCYSKGKPSIIHIIENVTLFHEHKNLLVVSENKSSIISHGKYSINLFLLLIINFYNQS